MNDKSNTSRLPVRGADVCQSLHWLAMGHSNPEELAAAYLDAAERINPRLNAFVDLRPDMVSDQARAASRRRSEGV
ncbi:MAG: amidase, partial [Rhodanobacteraceae bacterium]